MRWPIRNQILVPFSIVLVVSIVAATAGATWLAGRRVERRIVGELNRVISTLGDPRRSNFPLSTNVLETMRGLSGAEFVVLDDRGTRTAGTIEVDAESLADVLDAASVDRLDSLGEHPAVGVDGRRFLVVALDRPNRLGRRITLVTLYPETALDQARAEATLPPLLTGGALLACTILLAAWVAGRTAGRIRGVQQKVARVADGDFDVVDLEGPDDEIRELSASVNRMAARLRELQESMRRSERARLLGQLAGGLAHQLRNAATGARLALQLHLKRHSDADNEGLEIALRQLTLVEEQIKALLSLGREEDRPLTVATVASIVEDVSRLVHANCEHEKVDFSTAVAEDVRERAVPDGEGTRSAVLNLVLNGIEAAGPGGRVGLAVEDVREKDVRDEDVREKGTAAVSFAVVDSGPGPDEAVGSSVFDPFVTSKPEGVGLGLALVRNVAERAGGHVDWDRVDGETRFRLVVPTRPGGGV